MKKFKIIAVFMALCLTLAANIYSQSTNGTNGGPGTVSDVFDNSIYLSQSTPGEMSPGVRYGVSVTMKNTGRSTWKQGSYSLKLINTTESAQNTWSVNTVDVN